MKKLIFSSAIILSLGLAACGDTEETSNKEETPSEESVPVEKVEIDMTYANDSSIPLGDRIKKVATDLFGDTTVQKTDRNITIENMGELYYLKMMIDDGVTKDNTLSYAQKNTVALLEVLQGVDDFQQININWQGNFKDNSGNSNVGSALTVMVKKENIENVNFEEFDASKLKEITVNYGVHNDFK